MAYNDRLFTLLRRLEPSELDDVWHLLGRNQDDEDFSRREALAKIEPISHRLRAVASHDIRRIFRGAHDRDWKDILVQIAAKLKIGDPDTLSEEELEIALWQKLDPDDPNSHKRLASVAGWKAYLRGMLVVPFPINALGRVLMGPSYRKLVPAVLYIIDRVQLRERLEQEKGVV